MILRTLMLALVAVLFAGFTSCSKSSDDEPKSKELTGFTLTIDVATTEDELAVGNLVIEYLDENGKKQAENITKTQWSKTLTFKNFPATTAYSLKHSMKDGVTLSKEKYNLGLSIKPTYKVVFSDNSTTFSSQSFWQKSAGTNDCTKDAIAPYFKEKNGVFFSTKCTINKSEKGDDIVSTEKVETM